MTTLQADQFWVCSWYGKVAHQLSAGREVFPDPVLQVGEYCCGRSFDTALRIAPDRMPRCEKCVRKV